MVYRKLLLPSSSVCVMPATPMRDPYCALAKSVSPNSLSSFWSMPLRPPMPKSEKVPALAVGSFSLKAASVYFGTP